MVSTRYDKLSFLQASAYRKGCQLQTKQLVLAPTEVEKIKPETSTSFRLMNALLSGSKEFAIRQT